MELSGSAAKKGMCCTRSRWADEGLKTFDWTLSEDVLKQAKGVIGYKVKVREASLKYKLSQNRSDKDYKNVVLNLRDSDNQDDNRLADEMEKIRTI